MNVIKIEIIFSISTICNCLLLQACGCLHSVGTAGIVIQVTGTNWPRPAYTLLVTGLCRFKLERIIEKSPYLIASVSQLDRLPGEEAGKQVYYFV